MLQMPSAPTPGQGPRRTGSTVAQILPEADEEGRWAALHFIIKRTFDIVPNGLPVQRDRARPLWLKDIPYDGMAQLDASLRFVSELCPPKPLCDLVVNAHCHPPGGESADCTTRLVFDTIDKSVRVVGDRAAWLPTGETRARLSPPRPYAIMPLRWEWAYGGVDQTGFSVVTHPLNPLGRGYWTATSFSEAPPEYDGPKLPAKQRADRFGALPNLLPPDAWPNVDQLLTAPNEALTLPEPVGFGWLPQRWSAGSLNRAPLDQRCEHPRGAESVRLQNMHTGHAELSFQLPVERPKVQWNRGNGREVVAVKLDTILIEPDFDVMDCLWRGTLKIPEGQRPWDLPRRLIEVDGVFVPWAVKIDAAIPHERLFGPS